MTETKAKAPAIYAALASVMKGMENIPKNGVMKFGQTSYEYLRADDVQERLNPLLVENGVVVRSSFTVRDVDRGNRQWVYVDLDLVYVSVEDGSEFATHAVGESAAGDDKSVNKALTQAVKNCHRATFQFASGEREPDDSPEPPVSRTVNQIDKARQAPTPKAAATGKPLSKDIIRTEWIDTGKVSRDKVNEIMAEVKDKHNLAGNDLMDAVLERLKTNPAGN